MARLRKSLAIFFDIGTGKTATAIHILREDYNSQKRIRPTLIFTKLTVCQQWADEFSKFSKIPPEKILVLTGPGRKRVEQMQRMPAPGKIVITNYEAVQIEGLYAELKKFAPEIIVLDECHSVRDSSSGRAKRIYPLTDQADRKLLLTGTPMPNSMLELFGQYRAMDPSIFGRNFFGFRGKYFYDKNAHMPRHVHFPNWQPLPSAAAELGQILSQSSVQAKRHECIDLPPLLEPRISVEMSPQQARAYRQMEKDYITEMQSGEKVIAEFAMTKTLRMQQLLCGFAPVFGDPESDPETIWFDDVPRLTAYRELLEQLHGERVIVWTTFAPTYRKLAGIAAELKRKTGFLTGQQTAMQKQQAIDQFRSGEIDTLIAHPRAGGVGVNLTEAKFAIYYTRGYSSVDFEQSQGRNYRGGSAVHDKITQYHLYTPETLDEVIAQSLWNKQDAAEKVLAWARNKS